MAGDAATTVGTDTGLVRARVKQWEKKETKQDDEQEDWLYQEYPDLGTEVLKD